jgi:3-methyladenine DNA glycosylase/8-oxoguanine DNA glycosylase
VPLAEFQRLTRFPILVIYGDHLEARASHLAGFANTKAFVRALARRGGDGGDPSALAERWRPYRAYAAQHLWLR